MQAYFFHCLECRDLIGHVVTRSRPFRVKLGQGKGSWAGNVLSWISDKVYLGIIIITMTAVLTCHTVVSGERCLGTF